MKKTIKLPKEEATDLVTGWKVEDSEYEPFDVLEHGPGTYGNIKEGVIKNKKTGELYSHTYEIDETKHGEYWSWEYETELEFHLVERKEKVITQVYYETME